MVTQIQKRMEIHTIQMTLRTLKTLKILELLKILIATSATLTIRMTRTKPVRSILMNFYGIGIINNREHTGIKTETALLNKTDLHLKDHSDRLLSKPYTYFMDSPDQGNSKGISLTILGDTDYGTLTYTTAVKTTIPLQWLEVLKAEQVSYAPFSTFVEVIG